MRHVVGILSAVLLLVGLYYVAGAAMTYGSASDLREEQPVASLWFEVAAHDFEARAVVFLLLGGIGAALSTVLYRRRKASEP